MVDQPSHSLRSRQCLSLPTSKNSGDSNMFFNSDGHVVSPKKHVDTNNTRKRDLHEVHSLAQLKGLGEYYKKYEHDEVPVKDSNLDDISCIRNKGSLTNSDLDKLESKIFKNMSQELQTNDDNSKSSLESNIKFFKTTVLEIFDNFYASMRDFELYKERFNVILEKNKEDAVADMEDFIKDMIQHIMSSETLISSEGRKTNDCASLLCKEKDISNDIDGGKSIDLAYCASLSCKDKVISNDIDGGKSIDLAYCASLSCKEKDISNDIDGGKSIDLAYCASLSCKDKDISNNTDGGKSIDLASLSCRVSDHVKDKQTNVSIYDDESSYATNTSGAENLHSVIEAYRNDNYLTDSTLDDNSQKAKNVRKDEILNIYLLSANPCVQIKINERNLLSEINVKEPFKCPDRGKHVASADNMERLAAKKMELEKYVKQDHDFNVPDREIPVKVSYAKKNIYLNEDFSQERETDKSFITKLCNYLCRKFRKTT